MSATTKREMFRAWCRKEKFNNGKALSHVLMDGGCLSVPYNRLEDFYEKYVEAVRSGDEKVFVVEQKTERYNFFVDIEGHAEDPGIAAVLADMQGSVAFYKFLGSYPRAVT